VPVPTSGNRCERLPLSIPTKRVLWSESGGYCQNPACAVRLFDGDSDVDFGELAHIVAATSGGPRDVPVVDLSAEQRAHHDNVVLLCANCHTAADKDPERYPAELMRQWKAGHRKKLEAAFGTPKFAARAEAHAYVEPLLAANHVVHRRYGPVDDEFSEERATLWRRHVLGTMIGNNATVNRVLQVNRELLTPAERNVADLFAVHIREFEARHLLGDWSAGTLVFPEGMDQLFKEDG
jgi:hypothetical protein